jgi:hypothetical protein
MNDLFAEMCVNAGSIPPAANSLRPTLVKVAP